MAELTLRDPQRVLKRTRWHGMEHIEALRESGKNAIF